MFDVTRLDAVARFVLLAFAAVLGFSRAGIHAAVMVLALIFLCRFLRQPLRINFDEKLSLAMKIFFGTMILSMLFSSDHLASAKYLGKLFFRFLPFFIVLAFANEKKLPERAAVLMAGSISFGSLVAIFQGLHGDPRAKSFLGQMDFGGILGLLIPLLVIQGMENREYTRWQKKLLLAAALLGCVAMLFNGTRAIWISVGICLLGLLFLVRRRNAKVMIAAAVLGVMVVAIGLSSPQVTERFNTLFDMNYANNAQRVILWKYGWGLFLDHPVMGTGLATLPTPPFFISPEEAASGKPIYGHVHNNFLQMLAENGIIGFGGFVFLFGTIIYTGWTRRGGAGRAWGLTAAVCTSEFLIHGLFDYTLNIPTVVYSYWFIMGFVYVKYRQGDTWRKGDQ